MTHRYVYLGTKETAPRFRGQLCNPVLDAARQVCRRTWKCSGGVRRREPDRGAAPATAADGEAGVIRLRWRAIFEPWCWVVRHRVHRVESVPMGFEGLGCWRCSAFAPFSKLILGADLPRRWKR
jgi:hypothetical protein